MKQITIIMAFVLIFACGQISASTIEIIGDDALATHYQGSTGGKSKGNVLAVNYSVNLEEMEFLLNFTGPQYLSFYVYELNGPNPFGNYTQIYQNTVYAQGAGQAFYGSGAINNVVLNQFSNYYTAVSWVGGGLTYYFDDYSNPVINPYNLPLSFVEGSSFGSCIQPNSFLTPLSPILNIVANSTNKGVFTERFTTSPYQPHEENVVPEPMSAVFLITGGLFLAGVKRFKKHN